MGKRKICKIVFVILSIFLCVAFYELFGICIAYKKQPEVSNTIKKETQNDSWNERSENMERAVIIEKNPEALLQRVRLIKNAKKEIILSTFSFKSDESGKLILGALHDAADRGVHIRLLVDGMESWIDMEGNPYFYGLSSHENVEIKLYNKANPLKPWKMMGRMHDKYLIADGKTYILGGRNTYNYFLGDFLGHKNYDRDVLVVCDEPEKENSVNQLSEYFVVGKQARAGGEHHKVAGLDIHALAQSRHLLVREELDDGAVDGAVLAESDPRQTLGAKRGGHAGKLIDLGTCPGTGALGVDSLDDRALLVCGSRKDLELGIGEDVGQVDQVHAIAGIGLVGAIGVHGLPVVHATQRRGHLDAHAAEGIGQDLLERAHDVVLVHEGHLDIDLGELGLTVGTQVLVAEALGNLVVALDATDHKQLLQELRGLRQGVEVARLNTAGNDEVASALGRGLKQGGRLDLHELTVVQRLANGKGKVGAQLEVGHHLGTTKVQIAIAQAGVLAGLDAVLNLERRGDGCVEHLGVVGEDLDLAGRELGVGGLLAAGAHDAVNLDGPLGTHGLGDLKCVAVRVLGVEGELRDALTVAKVAEDKAAVVAATVSRNLINYFDEIFFLFRIRLQFY